MTEFTHQVEAPAEVGRAFGAIAPDSMDLVVLPEMLDSEDKSDSFFTAGFIQARFELGQWDWVNNLIPTSWTPSQIGKCLVFLPFRMETWDRSARLLVHDEGPYWSQTTANHYQADDGLEYAIDRLVEHHRPLHAVYCLAGILHKQLRIDPVQSIRVLQAILAAPIQIQEATGYDICQILIALQNESTTNQDDLCKLEFLYLGVFDSDPTAQPKTLYRRLGDDPEFFCEIIALCFRSRNNLEPAPKMTDKRGKLAANAYRLLTGWNTPPGTQADGVFDGGRLKKWLEHVKSSCTKSGHLEVALEQVGQVLAHAPADADGLWINRDAATVLNDKDAKELREGFVTRILNSQRRNLGHAGQRRRDNRRGVRIQGEGAGGPRIPSPFEENSGYFGLLSA